MQQSRLRLGIVGCGKIVSDLHVPAIRCVPEMQVTAVVDPVRMRASTVASQLDAPLIFTDHTALYDLVDAVLVAVPHAQHASVSADFLKRGIHVLCEKPMATSLLEARLMIDAAQQTKSILAIGLMRRFYDNMRFVKGVIEKSLFGSVERFLIQESVPFDKITSSAFYVDRNVPGAGVLFDTGAHTLDMLLWWFGDVESVRYWDDNRGGVEANCRIELTMKSGVTGIVELSRMRRFTNSVRIWTDKMVIDVPTLEHHCLAIFDRQTKLEGKIELKAERPPLADDSWVNCFARQFEDFAQSILLRQPPAVSGEAAICSLKLIEHCISVRQPLPMSAWETITNF